MYISELLTTHPEICGDRHRLSFSNVTPPGIVEDALHSDGAVMLRSALPPNVLRSARRAFRRFAHRLNEPRSPFDQLDLEVVNRETRVPPRNGLSVRAIQGVGIGRGLYALGIVDRPPQS